MSNLRYRPSASKTPIEYDTQGRTLCRYCKNTVPSFRQTFCSARCIHEWRMRTDKNYVREQVKKRDSGICARCGVDCLALRSSLIKTPRDALFTPTQWEAHHKQPVVEGGGLCGLENYATLCLDCHYKETAKQKRARDEANKNKRIQRILHFVENEDIGASAAEIAGQFKVSPRTASNWILQPRREGLLDAIYAKSLFSVTEKGKKWLVEANGKERD